VRARCSPRSTCSPWRACCAPSPPRCSTATRSPVERAGPFAYLAGAARTALGTAAGAPALAAAAARGAPAVGGPALGTAAAVVRGAVLAVPVLVVFGALLAGADRTFARALERLVAWDAGPLAGHAVATLTFAWLAGGYLYVALLAPPAHGAERAARGAQRLAEHVGVGARELCVTLALVDALLLAFGVLQLGWLFGGARALDLAGVTVAEYARRGFFELLAVAALALPLLLVAAARVGGDARAVGARPRGAPPAPPLPPRRRHARRSRCLVLVVSRSTACASTTTCSASPRRGSTPPRSSSGWAR
jgi:hypothetical protein